MNKKLKCDFDNETEEVILGRYKQVYAEADEDTLKSQIKFQKLIHTATQKEQKKQKQYSKQDNNATKDETIVE